VRGGLASWGVRLEIGCFVAVRGIMRLCLLGMGGLAVESLPPASCEEYLSGAEGGAWAPF